jgi:hypothetical protein
MSTGGGDGDVEPSDEGGVAPVVQQPEDAEDEVTEEKKVTVESFTVSE